VSNLPTTWRWATIDDIAGGLKSNVVIGPFGSSLKVSDYTDSGVPLVFVRNIRVREFDGPETRFVSPEKAVRLQAHEVRPGDVLITKMGDPPGDCAVYPNLPAALVTADCIRLRPGPMVEAKFLAYAFESAVVRQQFREITRGVAQQKVSLARFRQGVAIPLPPLDEQQRIVDLLEDHLSRLDAASGQLHDVIRRSKAWAAALADEALQMVPERAPVADLLRAPMRNGHSARAVAGGGIRTLTLTTVTRGEFTDEHTKLTDADPRRVKDLWLTSGDILVQRSNTAELVGTSARYTGPDAWAIYPDLMIRLRPDESRVLSPFLAAALASERVHRSMRARAKGLAGSMPKIDQETIGSTLVPLPDLETQRRLVERIGLAKTQANRLVAGAQRGVRRATALRRSLLDAALSGRL
jgi:type I restriction enzyme S subunit